MTMKHVYISGPMTGLPHLNFPAFHTAAAALRAMGYKVTNPAELNPDPKADWRACMRTDIRALCECDGLVLLLGWGKSEGAHIELNLAHRLGMQVETLDNLLNPKRQQLRSALQTLHRVCKGMDLEDQMKRPTEGEYLAAMFAAEEALKP